MTRRAVQALIGASGLSACVRSGAPDELHFWAMGREGEVAQSLIADFAAAHPGVKVRAQQLPWSAAHAKLLTAFAGGSLPDVCQVGNTWLAEFIALRALAPLDGLVAYSTSIRPDDYFPGIWRTNVIEGRLWGVPWYVDTRLLFYRQDLVRQAGFDKPATTWDDWLKAMQAVKRKAGPDDFAVLMPLNEYEPLLALALQQPDPLLADGATRGNFRSAGFRRALAFYGEIFRLGLAPVLTSIQVSNLYDEVARGAFAYCLSGPWSLGEFRRRLPPPRQGEWATMPLPGPNGPGAGTAGGSSLVLLDASPRKVLAWRLIEHLSRADVQSRFYGEAGDLPPRRSAWDKGQLARDSKAAAFRDQLERVRPAPAAPEWERIATEMQLVAEAMVRGRYSVDEAAAEMDRRADRLLEKRRWLAEESRARAGWRT